MQVQTIIYNGQGSLTEDTSEDRRLFDAFPPIREIWNFYKRQFREDLASISFDGSIEERRRHQQKVVLAKQAALTALVQGGLELDEYNSIDLGFRNPMNSTLGLSMGEFNSWLAAGMTNLKTMYLAMRYRNEIMWGVNTGGLTAYLGASLGDIEKVSQQEGAYGVSLVKVDGNISVGAVKDVRDRIYDILKEQGKVKKSIETDVRGAIHTCEFDATAKDYEAYLRILSDWISRPQMDVWSGVAQELYRGTTGDTIQKGKDHMRKTFYLGPNLEREIKRQSALARGVEGFKHTLLVVGHGAAGLEKSIVGRVVKGVKKSAWAAGKGADALSGLETRVIETVPSVIKYWKEMGFKLNFEPNLGNVGLVPT